MSEHPSDSRPDSRPDTAGRFRNWRHWRIPNRIHGRIRTSTVFFGICFVLTALLYIQVNEDVTAANREAVLGPVAVDTSQLESAVPQQTYRSTTVTTTPSTTVDPSTTAEPSGTDGQSGQQGSPSDSTGASTTQDPTFLPGLTVPPGLRSLIPPAPQASTTGTP